MKKKVFGTVIVLLLVVGILAGCSNSTFDASLPYYDMNIYDLSGSDEGVAEEYKYMYARNVVDEPQKGDYSPGGRSNYLGHPDSVMLDSGEVLTAYPKGHGRGGTVIKRSYDMGANWSDRQTNLPESFEDTQETPTIYKLDFVNGDQKLVMISGRPGWGTKGDGQGFDVSLSTSQGAQKCDGATWSAHENFYGPNAQRDEYKVAADVHKPITAMSSLVRLKGESGALIDKWMGVYHDYDFNVMKTYLTFDSEGEMDWTLPERLLDDKYRANELKYNYCEPEIVRSPEGNEMAVLFRTNARISLSYVAFSTDEGMTWSTPQPLSRELTGDRHKAEYCPITGKLVITYRAYNWKVGQEYEPSASFSRGWVVWIGDYAHLKAGAEGKGDFMVKLAHTYKDGQSEIDTLAFWDTGYAGLVIDDSGLIMTASYGKFTRKDKNTYVIAKQFKINDLIGNFNMA